MVHPNAKAIGVAVLALAIAISRKKRQRQKNQRVCQRKKRLQPCNLVAYNRLLSDLRSEDPTSCKNYLRMDNRCFDLLLQRVKPLIEKKGTLMRKAIPAGERLAVTLRYLATGDSFTGLSHLYQIPKSSLSFIIPETCEAIYKVLQDYMKVPSSEEEWKHIAQEYEQIWAFNHCIGAIDCKHIQIKPPHESGSSNTNAKGFHSVILFSVVDADYKFTFVDTCTNDGECDSRIFSKSKLFHTLENNTMRIPTPEPLPGRNMTMPYVLIGSSAFPLKPYLMTPYPSTNLTAAQKAYNYRLCRAQCLAENAFGVLANRFRILLQIMPLIQEKVEKIALACCVLHNFLRTECAHIYCPPGIFDTEDEEGTITPGTWRSDTVLQSLSLQGNDFSLKAQEVRDEFTAFFSAL